MSIAELLDRLKVADPATWYTIYEAGFNRCNWPDDLIQGCIQRAIQARGWGYQIMQSRVWQCQADISTEDDIIDGKSCVSAAEAILAAYLAALEAVG